VRVIQQWKEWLATIPDGKLPTNQRLKVKRKKKKKKITKKVLKVSITD
jgi:hypothetical protein